MRIERKATARKATPAQKKLPPVRNHTTAAIIAAGRMKSKTLAMIMITTMPMTRSISSRKMSNTNPSPFIGSMDEGITLDHFQESLEAIYV